MGVGLSDGTYFQDEGEMLVSAHTGMPPEASEKPAGALKSSEGSQTPDSTQNLSASFLERLTGTPNPRPVTDILIDFAKEKAAHLVDALSLPGDAWAGKVDPMSPQGIERAQTLAGLMVGGPAPVAVKMADGTLGSFAGVKSKTLPKENLYKAQNMELEGAHADDIWDAAGFMRGADNRWKYEINDRNADFNPEALEMTNYSKRRLEEEAKNPPPKGWGGHEPMFMLPARGSKDPLKLGNIFDHPELYAAYPHLQGIDVIPVNAVDQLSGIKGYFDKGRNILALAPDTMENMRSVTLHEIQHAIQAHEGFSTGANTNIFKTQRWEDLHKAYQDYKKDVESTIKDFFPENQGKMWDLIRALKNEDMLGHYKEMAGQGYKSNAQLYEQTKRDLELIDKVPNLRESLTKIIKGDEIVGKYDHELYKKYFTVKGEVEARNVQDRRNYTLEDRQGTPAYRTEDVPRQEQIWSPMDPSSLRDLSR